MSHTAGGGWGPPPNRQRAWVSPFFFGGGTRCFRRSPKTKKKKFVNLIPPIRLMCQTTAPPCPLDRPFAGKGPGGIFFSRLSRAHPVWGKKLPVFIPPPCPRGDQLGPPPSARGPPPVPTGAARGKTPGAPHPPRGAPPRPVAAAHKTPTPPTPPGPHREQKRIEPPPRAKKRGGGRKKRRRPGGGPDRNTMPRAPWLGGARQGAHGALFSPFAPEPGSPPPPLGRGRGPWPGKKTAPLGLPVAVVPAPKQTPPGALGPRGSVPRVKSRPGQPPPEKTFGPPRVGPFFPAGWEKSKAPPTAVPGYGRPWSAGVSGPPPPPRIRRVLRPFPPGDAACQSPGRIPPRLPWGAGFFPHVNPSPPPPPPPPPPPRGAPSPGNWGP